QFLGGTSLREIASQHGISEGAIRKRAKRDDWSRDLNAKIQQKADDLVRKQEVRKQVRNESNFSEGHHSGPVRRLDGLPVRFAHSLLRCLCRWRQRRASGFISLRPM
ncbi:hypothetical protein ACT4US_31470, partial [Bacillus sp. HC-Mk]